MVPVNEESTGAPDISTAATAVVAEPVYRYRDFAVPILRVRLDASDLFVVAEDRRRRHQVARAVAAAAGKR